MNITWLSPSGKIIVKRGGPEREDEDGRTAGCIMHERAAATPRIYYAGDTRRSLRVSYGSAENARAPRDFSFRERPLARAVFARARASRDFLVPLTAANLVRRSGGWRPVGDALAAGGGLGIRIYYL